MIKSESFGQTDLNFSYDSKITLGQVVEFIDKIRVNLSVHPYDINFLHTRGLLNVIGSNEVKEYMAWKRERQQINIELTDAYSLLEDDLNIHMKNALEDQRCIDAILSEFGAKPDKKWTKEFGTLCEDYICVEEPPKNRSVLGIFMDIVNAKSNPSIIKQELPDIMYNILLRVPTLIDGKEPYRGLCGMYDDTRYTLPLYPLMPSDRKMAERDDLFTDLCACIYSFQNNLRKSRDCANSVQVILPKMNRYWQLNSNINRFVARTAGYNEMHGMMVRPSRLGEQYTEAAPLLDLNIPFDKLAEHREFYHAVASNRMLRQMPLFAKKNI